MTENMKKFFVHADENSELSEKLKNGLSEEEMSALAKEHGIELTEEGFKTNGKNLISTDGGTALSDEELDKVAGGGFIEGFEDMVFRVTMKCAKCTYIQRVIMKGSHYRALKELPCPCCGSTKIWRDLKMRELKDYDTSQPIDHIIIEELKWDYGI